MTWKLKHKTMKLMWVALSSTRTLWRKDEYRMTDFIKISWRNSDFCSLIFYILITDEKNILSTLLYYVFFCFGQHLEYTNCILLVWNKIDFFPYNLSLIPYSNLLPCNQHDQKKIYSSRKRSTLLLPAVTCNPTDPTAMFPVGQMQRGLSPVAKNKNSTHHFVYLNTNISYTKFYKSMEIFWFIHHYITCCSLVASPL